MLHAGDRVCLCPDLRELSEFTSFVTISPFAIAIIRTLAQMDIHATVKTLKQHKQGQISKIQLKAEAEIELLEYMRDYMAVKSFSDSNDSMGFT